MLQSLSPSQIKALSHPTRVAILRALMHTPSTLSQLGEQFETSPAHIRHHLKVLQDCNLVEPDPDHPLQNHLEKYYRASPSALIAQLAIRPEASSSRRDLTISSMDVGLGQVQSAFSAVDARIDLRVLPLNSLDGLVLLRQGICQMATCHLLDRDTHEYNRSYVRHIFPGQPMIIIPLFSRVEGLIVQAGNPFGLQRLEDLVRPGLRFINRERGSGIRIWLDQALKDTGIKASQVQGYQREASSHTQVAQMIASGQADAGLGTEAHARQLGLGFVPLFEEPYELVAQAELLSEPALAAFFEHLSGKIFRTMVRKLPGYLPLAASGQPETIYG